MTTPAKMTMPLLALVMSSGCVTPLERVVSLGSTDNQSLFVFIDGYVYECRTAGNGAKILDSQASQGGARSVCTRTNIVR